MKATVRDPLVFAQLRRLVLGIVVEVLRDEQIQIDLVGLTCAFGEDSGIRFHWFDNWMRFQGTVTAPLREPLDETRRARLAARFEAVWPEIVGALGTMPLADRLETTRHEVQVVAGEALEIRFDLEAD